MGLRQPVAALVEANSTLATLRNEVMNGRTVPDQDEFDSWREKFDELQGTFFDSIAKCYEGQIVDRWHKWKPFIRGALAGVILTLLAIYLFG
jgi:hypothetical protein